MSRHFASLVFGAALCALLASAGCHEDNLVENHHTDDPFIRLPGETEKTITGNGAIFPLHAGDKWSYIVLVGKDSAPSAEQVVDIGPTHIDGATGDTLEIQQSGKPTRHEVYRTEPSGGVSILATGNKGDLMSMSPALPLYQQPCKEGDTFTWSGILHFKNMSSPANAISRITGHDTVHVPAGTFTAYRLDTIIATTINGQAAAFPIKRWVAPGVGTVQQQMMSGELVVTKQLQSYTVAKK